MAFTLRPDGSITVDTSEELAEVLRINRREPAVSPADAVPVHARQVRSRVPDLPVLPAESLDGAYGLFYESLSPNHKALVSLLRNQGRASDDMIRDHLRLSSNLVLRGMLISLSKQAKKAKLGPVVEREISRVNGGKGRAYRYLLTPAFRRALKA